MTVDGGHVAAMVGAISACLQLGDAEMACALVDHVDQGGCGRYNWFSLFCTLILFALRCSKT